MLSVPGAGAWGGADAWGCEEAEARGRPRRRTSTGDAGEGQQATAHRLAWADGAAPTGSGPGAGADLNLNAAPLPGASGEAEAWAEALQGASHAACVSDWGERGRRGRCDGSGDSRLHCCGAVSNDLLFAGDLWTWNGHAAGVPWLPLRLGRLYGPPARGKGAKQRALALPITLLNILNILSFVTSQGTRGVRRAGRVTPRVRWGGRGRGRCRKGT